jgi:hypothetical protein
MPRPGERLCRSVPFAFAGARNAALCSLVLIAASLAACEEEGTEPVWPPMWWSSGGCHEGHAYPLSAHDLNPGQPVDYLALIAPKSVLDAGTWQAYPEVVSQWWSTPRSPCATCSGDALELPPERAPCVASDCEAVLVRRGELFERHSLKQIRTLLAPIDTPAEALLLVRGAGWDAGCADVHEERDAGESAYTVLAVKRMGPQRQEGPCFFVDEYRQVFEVHEDGTFVPRARPEVTPRSTACANR